MNGNPHSARFAIFSAVQVTGMLIHNLPIIRMSWLFCEEWMIVPAHTNSSALNKAWVTR